MKPIFACPYCNRELVDLKCFPCNFVGKFEDGIYHLHRSDASWDACMDQVSKIKAAEIKEKEMNRRTIFEATNPEGFAIGKANDDGQVTRFSEALKFLQPIQGRIILDMGGANAQKSSTFVDYGAELAICIEFKFVGDLRRGGNLIMVFGDNYHIPFLNGYFDIVFDSATLHHMVDKFAYISEVYRILKPGGIFYSYGSSPSPTPEKLAAMKGHQSWWCETYGIFETAWGIDECKDIFSKVFGKAVDITYYIYATPKGTVTGEDAVIWCVK